MESAPAIEFCPFLGVPDARGRNFTFPHPGHRCYAKRREAEIELDYQAGFCLSAAHTSCPRYIEAMTPKEVPAQPARARRSGGEEPLPDFRAAATGLAELRPLFEPTEDAEPAAIHAEPQPEAPVWSEPEDDAALGSPEPVDDERVAAHVAAASPLSPEGPEAHE